MESDRDVEKTYSKSEFIAELRRLADTLESEGAFTIEIDGEEISVPENATFLVEHEREDGRKELEFQLSWGAEQDEDDEEEEEEAEDADEDESVKEDSPAAV